MKKLLLILIMLLSTASFAKTIDNLSADAVAFQTAISTMTQTEAEAAYTQALASNPGIADQLAAVIATKFPAIAANVAAQATSANQSLAAKILTAVVETSPTDVAFVTLVTKAVIFAAPNQEAAIVSAVSTAAPTVATAVINAAATIASAAATATTTTTVTAFIAAQNTSPSN